MKKTVVLFSFLFCCLFMEGQNKAAISRDQVEKHLETQLLIYPQEKLYLHIDRTFYVPGEKLWFRAYLADASTHQLTSDSRYVYVELINARDSLISRLQIRPEQNIYYGHLLLPEEMSEGLYTLRAYTRYMENLGEDYYFRKQLRIGSLLSVQIKPEVNFTYDTENKKLLVDLYYTDGRGETKVRPDRLQVRNEKGQMRNVKIDKDTIAHFSLDLPIAGRMKSLYFEADNFKHDIMLPAPEDDYDVSFYPEGGYLVDHTINRVGFKALNAKGLSEEIEGELINEEGEVLFAVSTYHAGMGIVSFIPEKGKNYYLRCRNQAGVTKQFVLPDSYSDRYTLVANWKDNKYYVGVHKPPLMELFNPLYLLVHCRGELCYFGAWDEGKDFVVFNKGDFPAGIIQMVLLDHEMNPLSERLLFSHSRQNVVLSVETDKPSYADREKVSVQLALKGKAGVASKGSLSVAVTDDQDVAIDSMQTILTSFLFTSELKGHIENPAFYLDTDNPVAANALELLMMVHGWRRYDLSKTLKGEYVYPSRMGEASQVITGKVKSPLTSKPVSKGEVFLFANLGEGGFFSEQTQTNEEGRFYFGGFELPDSTKVFIQSLNQKGKANVELLLDEFTYPLAKHMDVWKPAKRAAEAKPLEDTFLEKAEQRAKYDDNMRVIHLKEIEVVASRRLTLQEERGSVYSSVFTTAIEMEEIEKLRPSRIEQLFNGVAGVDVRAGEFGDFELYIRKAPQPALVLVNNMEADPSTYSHIHPSEVARIEIYKGAEATIFGVRGGFGAVNILLKSAVNYKTIPKERSNIKTFELLGYQRPAEFYAPKYETPEDKSSYLPDLRPTLYWMPNVFTGEEGKATFEFYTSDVRNTTYSVVIEGVTQDGAIVREVKKIHIE